MIVTTLKLAHVAAIALWAAGLIALPYLFRQRHQTATPNELNGVHALVRFVYVVLVSPAAFVAVASGTALIFARQTFTPWFTVKLALVAMLIVVHVLTGRLILRLFDDGGRYAVFRYVIVTTLTVVLVAAILTVVLAKPDITAPAWMPEWVSPGGLGERLAPLIRRWTS